MSIWGIAVRRIIFNTYIALSPLLYITVGLWLYFYSVRRSFSQKYILTFYRPYYDKSELNPPVAYSSTTSNLYKVIKKLNLFQNIIFIYLILCKTHSITTPCRARARLPSQNSILQFADACLKVRYFGKRFSVIPSHLST